MRGWVVAVACLLMLPRIASADDDEVLAPTATAQPTKLSGRVTDILGSPVVEAAIDVAAPGGTHLRTKTDRDGRYALTLPGGGTYVLTIVAGQTKVSGPIPVEDGVPATIDVPLDIDATGGEIIHVRDKPKVQPKPTFNVRKSLPYSKQAMERDAWGLAWLLLDIDERGEVARVKLLKHPGFDLDKIAVDEAFELKFEPARDAAGKPMRTLMLWKLEWPAWGWLLAFGGLPTGRPADHDALYQVGRQDVVTSEPTIPVTMSRPLSRVPCVGSGPLNLDSPYPVYRDCSKPDLTNLDAQPWITRTNAPVVLAQIAAAAPVEVRVHRSRIPELVAGAATVAFGAVMVVSVAKYNHYGDIVSKPFVVGDDLASPRAEFTKWQHRMFESGFAFVASGVTTMFLWNRRQTRSEFSVQPTKGGGSLTFSRSF